MASISLTSASSKADTTLRHVWSYSQDSDRLTVYLCKHYVLSCQSRDVTDAFTKTVWVESNRLFLDDSQSLRVIARRQRGTASAVEIGIRIDGRSDLLVAKRTPSWLGFQYHGTVDLPQPRAVTPKQRQHALFVALFKAIPTNGDKFYQHNDYGDNSSSEEGYRNGHSGWDVVRQGDSPRFYSLTEGTVELAQNGELDGQLTIYTSIDTDECRYSNITVTYLHADSLFVSMGDEVEAGEPLGTQGNRHGYRSHSNGAHVHVEVREGRTTNLSTGKGQTDRAGRHETLDPILCLYPLVTH